MLPDYLAHDQRWEGTRATWSRLAAPAGLTRVPLGDLDDRQLSDFAGRRHGAILCSNDQGALQVWHRLNRLGIAVPQRVLLAGFDGDEYGSLIHLTTAVFDVPLFARTAFQAIESLLARRPLPKSLHAPIALTLRAGETA